MVKQPAAIRIGELEQLIQHAFHLLKERYGEQGEIPLEHDFYWDIIAVEELYNPVDTPAELTLGQLSDDCTTVHQHHYEEELLGYELKKAAMLLRYIGQMHSTL